ncbi:MAG: universal stress protein [Kiloniellales bacterium]|nr:universal stress protein [Kiloniellales bacterium]
MFNNILVPVDGSGPASNALGFGIDLAKRYDASIMIAHVQLRGSSLDILRHTAEAYGFIEDVQRDFEDVQLIPTAGGPLVGVPMVVIPDDLSEKVGRLLLSRILADVRASGIEDSATRLLDGSPARAILELAAETNTDLIVIGSRGHGNLTALVMGSVSHKVAQDSPCPCLIVK